MATSLIRGPGLCAVCGVFVPSDPKRPGALHICPGHRVVPSLREGYGRLVVLIGEYKAAMRADRELEEDKLEELSTLLGEHKDKYSKKRLVNWTARLQNQEAIVQLADAGRIVIRAYAAHMEDGFAEAVANQFANRKVDEEVPCTCFVWHQKEKHWNQRFAVLGLTKPAGEVDGMTNFWDGKEVRAGKGVLAGNYPPLNRSIEFPRPKIGTLVHEMIHWCTSPEYDRMSDALKDNDRATVREGTTEWLKRNALGNWEEGGYKDVFPVMRQIIDSGAITPDQLMAAYFGGRNVRGVIDAILASYHADNDRRGQAALSADLIARRKLYSEQTSSPYYVLRKRSADYRDLVAKTFAGATDAELAAHVKNAAWLKYLRARAGGADDATALL